MPNDVLHLKRQIINNFQAPEPPLMPDCIVVGTEAFEETESFWGKPWGALSLDMFDTNCDVLFFLPNGCFSFFFGFMMLESICEGRFDNAALDMFLLVWSEEDMSEFNLDLDGSEMRREILAGLREALSSKQIDVISNYFEYRKTYFRSDYDLVEKFICDLHGIA